MNTSKILDSEISGLKVASLPTRPTAPQNFGGKGYTAAQMKAAFDKLPLFIIDRFNMLLDDIVSNENNSLAAAIPTGISEGHTLRSLFLDILAGEFAKYLSVGEESLSDMKERIGEALQSIFESLEIIFSHINDSVIDAGRPEERNLDTGEVLS
jgi:hypothetical protein